MPLYTFYLCKPDGSAPSFEAHELAGDGDTEPFAVQLLQERPAYSHVVVTEGERELLVKWRPVGDSEAAVVAATAVAVFNAEHATGLKAAVIVTDPTGAIVFWNPAASRLYGWNALDALGRDVMDVTPSVQSRRQAGSIMSALQAGEPWEGEIVLKKRSGAAFRAFVADTPVGDVAAGDGFIVGVSAPADERSVVWQAQAELLAQLRRAPGA